MEALRLKVRQPAEDQVENWDDGDFMMDGDDFSFRNSSGTSRPPSRRRDSGSSHMSLRSDLESWTGEDERQVHIPGDDEKSTSDAIFAAQSAGIPLPKNIPSSALMGGTIKRLGGKKIRKIIQEDWENDLELPDTTQGLKIKFQKQNDFPETLRQVSTGSVHSSPVKLGQTSPRVFGQVSPRAFGQASPRALGQISPRALVQTSPRALVQTSPRALVQTSPRTLGQSLIPKAPMVNLLDKFKDNEDDDFFGDGYETIKVSKQRPGPKPVSLITPPTPSKNESVGEPEDDFEKDLELPSHGKLQLSTRRDIPKTPSAHSDDLDWGEGSLGTRFGGTRRDGRSNRSSSASALSPSVSSSITMESEDETFDGLLLPAGPVNFQERLQQRKKSRSPERIPEEGPSPPKKTSTAEADKPDFLDGLDFGEGDPFNAGKLTLHKNIKVKEARPSSPARPKTAVSLTFTNKPVVNTRIPRLSHERAHSTSLEPVSESGGPIPPRTRRPQSRLGHNSQSSVTSIPTPTTPSPNQRFPPSTPSRRELTTKVSTPSMRGEPTTTSAQLLKQKRSLPAIRALASKSYRFDSSTSRLDRPQPGVRPKTPVEQPSRPTIDSSAQLPTRKKSQPFLPAGASSSQSQHVNSKTVRQLRRHDSDNALDLRPHSRAFSRSTMRSPSPQQRLRVAADTWERLSKPKTKKHFGDGHELDAFDDLPTSKETETRFLRQPVGTNGSKPLLRRAGPSIADRMNTPSPHMSTKSLSTPRFARDTTASRIARETSLANRNSISGPLAPVSAQRAVQSSPAPAPTPALSVRTTSNLQSTVRSKKSKRPVQQKPHLISNLNAGKESKTVNGMFYNADTFRWEGNENALSAFDAGVVTPTAAPSAPAREKDTTTPRPALITNISTTKGVQVVNGMVFDPSSMCWLKLGAQQEGPKSDKSDPLENFNALEDDEDVFKDIPDLEENAGDDEGGQGRVSDINDDWLVGEEFDVGPEFIRRQREEEDRWRKKCDKWVGRGVRDREIWRWTIRELVSQFDELPM